MSRVVIAVVTIVCILGGLIVVADIAMILVLKSENAHNAWYFPYSLIVGPVVVIALALLWLARTLERRRRNHADSDRPGDGAH